MAAKRKMFTQEEAARQVLSIVNRMALLHYAYAKTLLKELGEKKGKGVVAEAIKFYGEQVGKQVREKTQAKGLKNYLENYQEDLPLLGWTIQKGIINGDPR